MKRNTVIAALILIIFCHTSSMETETLPKQYLLLPEQYADFRLTRPYGKPLQSDFDCFPKEVLEACMCDLREAIVTRFKHKTLNHKYQLNRENKEPLWKPIPLTAPEWKSFEQHHGRYDIVPDVADYARWDDNNPRYYSRTIDDNRYFRLRAHYTTQPKISLYCLEEQYDKDNKNLDIVNEDHNIMIRLSVNGRQHYSLSNDGNWFFCSLEKNEVSLFDTNTLEKLESFVFDHPVVTFCSAYHSPLFAICNKDELIFISPQKSTLSRFSLRALQDPESMGFSSDDMYLCIMNKNIVALYDTSSMQAETLPCIKVTLRGQVRIAFFSKDKSMVIALDNGKLLLWDDLSQWPIENSKHHPTWSCGNNAHNAKPLMSWNKDNKLLLSLDPIENTDQNNETFRIHKSTNGKLLAAHTLSPNNPVGMGLTKDERSIIFRDKDNNVSRLDLYDDAESTDIDFIANKANFYQLYCLWHTYRCGKSEAKEKIKPGDQKKLSLIEVLRFHIRSYRGKDNNPNPVRPAVSFEALA